MFDAVMPAAVEPRPAPSLARPGTLVASALLHVVTVATLLWLPAPSRLAALAPVELVLQMAASEAAVQAEERPAEAVPVPPPPPEPSEPEPPPSQLLPNQQPPPPPPLSEQSAVAPAEPRPAETAAPLPPPSRPTPSPRPARPRSERSATGPHAPATATPPTAASPPAAAAPAQPVGTPVMNAVRFRRPPQSPDYPEIARERGLAGTVVIRALISPDGETVEVRLHRSSGHAVLDSAAMNAVRRWAFEPASIDGRRTAAWAEVPLRFNLN